MPNILCVGTIRENDGQEHVSAIHFFPLINPLARELRTPANSGLLGFYRNLGLDFDPTQRQRLDDGTAIIIPTSRALRFSDETEAEFNIRMIQKYHERARVESLLRVANSWTPHTRNIRAWSLTTP